MAQSPLPQEEERELMDFPEAIREATIGKKIRREFWPEGEFGYFRGDFLMIHKDSEDFFWRVSMGDAVESDWVSF